MALINCPSCGKKISDKAAECQHCGFGVGTASDEDLSRKANLRKYKKSHSIQNQSMVAMLMFVSGFLFMFWGDTTPADVQYQIAFGCSTVGFFWYVINRIRLIMMSKR